MTGTELIVTLAVCLVLWQAGSAVFRHHPRLRLWFGYTTPPAEKPPADAIARHPAGKVRGLSRDGRPLDDYERRILGRVEMDSMVDVSFDPDYDKREESR